MNYSYTILFIIIFKFLYLIFYSILRCQVMEEAGVEIKDVTGREANSIKCCTGLITIGPPNSTLYRSKLSLVEFCGFFSKLLFFAR